MIAGYPTFLELARRAQWDAEAIDLAPDAVAWPGLDDGLRARLLELIAGFHVGEAAVAEELGPFADAAGEEAAACFAAQARDERRHARFFDRLAAEVARVPGDTPVARRAVLRDRLDPRFLALFEDELPRASATLAAGGSGLADAVGLYHMVLEGVVFTAGQAALLDTLATAPLPGMRTGAELTLRDERWHIGFGTRCLLDAGLDADGAERIAATGEAASGLWAPADKPAEMLRRRLGALRRAAAAPSAR